MSLDPIDTFKPLTRMATGASLYFGADTLARLGLRQGDKVHIFRDPSSGEVVLRKVGDPAHKDTEV